MPAGSQQLASAVNTLDGELASAWNALYGRSGGRRGGPAFAQIFRPDHSWSLRDVVGTNPVVINLRRDGDTAQRNFRAGEVLSSADWVNENGTQGFDTQLEDQVGGAFAFQSIAAAQPRLVVDSQVYLENGRPALLWDGIDDELLFPALNLTQPFTAVSVSTPYRNDKLQGIWGTGTGTTNEVTDYYDAAGNHSLFAGQTATGPSHDALTQYIRCVVFDGANSTLEANGSTATLDPGTDGTTSAGKIGAYFSAGSSLEGSFQELHIWNRDMTPYLPAIKANLNNYYSATAGAYSDGYDDGYE